MADSATHTSPLKNSENKRLTRRFLGNHQSLTNFDKAELKAYIKGYQKFRYGYFTNEVGQREPAYHPVRQEYSYVN